MIWNYVSLFYSAICALQIRVMLRYLVREQRTSVPVPVFGPWDEIGFNLFAKLAIFPSHFTCLLICQWHSTHLMTEVLWPCRFRKAQVQVFAGSLQHIDFLYPSPLSRTMKNISDGRTLAFHLRSTQLTLLLPRSFAKTSQQVLSKVKAPARDPGDSLCIEGCGRMTPVPDTSLGILLPIVNDVKDVI